MNIRIYNILAQQKTTTLTRFHKYLSSPYFNVNESIFALFEVFQKSIIQKLPPINKQEIWLTIFKNKAFDDKRFRKLCSDLTLRFENFVTIESLTQDSLLKHVLLLKQINNLGLDELAIKAKENSSRFFNRFPEKSANYHLKQYEREKILYDIQSDNIKNNKDINQHDTIDNLSKNLDQFYVIEKLKLACKLVTLQREYKISNKPFEVEIILRLLNRNQLLDNPAISVYRNMYLMLTEKENKSYFSELKDLTSNLWDIFTNEEQSEIFSALLTHCIGHLNQGDTSYLGEILNLYDTGIEKEYMLKNGVLSIQSFRNYVVAGLRDNQYSKVESFIKNKSTLLDLKQRENALNYNLAMLNFYEKNHEDVIRFLSLVNYDDIWYNIRSRTLSIANYYELEEFDVLESQLDSFIIFLSRQKVMSENKVIIYKNFNSFLKKLLKIRPKEKEKKETLKQLILKEKQVINKTWLLDKLEEL